MRKFILLTSLGLSLKGLTYAREQPGIATGQFTGLQIVPQSLVDGSNLTSKCKKALEPLADCDESVANLQLKEYHGSLQDQEWADIACTPACRDALSTRRQLIRDACTSTPEIAPGWPVMALIDSINSGWNDLCLKDPETEKYCNDIIDSWKSYEHIQEIPKEQLCSYCFLTKLRTMQESQNPAYDEAFTNTLRDVHEYCGLEIPTDPSPSLFEAKSAVVASCSGGQTYVTQHGDTCDSIALNKSISAATLYYINPGLTNCNNIEDGLELCLPPSCAVTHTVKEDEDCVALALEWGASWTSLIDWNLGIDSRCLNLWSTNPFWGRVICVSPPGGQYKIPKKMKHMTTGDGNTGSHRYFKDSNSYESFRFDSQPPGETAQGTTDKCGEYIQAKSGVGCSRMLVDTTTAIPIDLFLQANPSLGTALECDKKLVPSLWYCLRPLRSRMSSI